MAQSINTDDTSTYNSVETFVGSNYGDDMGGNTGAIYGIGGNDTISAGGYAYGGDGNDYVSGQQSGAHLYGEAGDDTMRAYNSNDVVDGGDGNDYIWNIGGGGHTMYGGAGNDLIEGDDTRVGAGQAETLYGGAGNDTLNGYRGDDYYNGGAGVDTYVSDTQNGGGNNDTFNFETGDIEFASTENIPRFDMHQDTSGNSSFVDHLTGALIPTNITWHYSGHADLSGTLPLQNFQATSFDITLFSGADTAHITGTLAYV